MSRPHRAPGVLVASAVALGACDQDADPQPDYSEVPLRYFDLAVWNARDPDGHRWRAGVSIDLNRGEFTGHQCRYEPEHCSEWFLVGVSDDLRERIATIGKSDCEVFNMFLPERIGDPMSARYTVVLNSIHGCSGAAIFTRDLMTSPSDREVLAFLDDLLLEAGELGDWEYRFPVGEGRGE